MFSVASSPAANAEDFASSDQTHLAIFPQPPPTASMIIGMNVMPCAEHWFLVSRWLHLKSSYLVSAASPSWDDSARTSSRTPLVTAKSQQAGGPPRQRGRYTSAGRLELAIDHGHRHALSVLVC